MIRPRLRRSKPTHLYTHSEQLRPLSTFEVSHECDYISPRRASCLDNLRVPSPPHAMATRPPSLTEILLDVAPPPWNLTAFMAYLSHNHCMECLEFTLDSQRYAAFYDQHVSDGFAESLERVSACWQKLIEVYLAPCAPREINIPARVRDHLISIPGGPSPPHPRELAEAGRIVFELMNDSLLLPFLQSVGPLQADATMISESAPRPPPLRTPRFSSRYSTASHNVDFEGLSDDSGANSPSSTEPMTPPTTPPTSDWGFNGPPGGFQRAVAAHNKGWKKVGEKLGLSRKSLSSISRPIPTSSASDVDMSYQSHHDL